MNITQNIIAVVILILAFYCIILPSTQGSKRQLDSLQTKEKDSLKKWKRRQRRLDKKAQRERLHH